ncbi:hypothetical protein JCM10213v2_005443 [Rhodosporidiobolus nylandii]
MCDVRRHYLAKHATKLECPECQSSFARQDLLLRHIKVFHPARETPSPSELAEQLDLPPPRPVHQDSMDSTSSFNSQASTSAASLLGAPLTNSPELLGHSFIGELPVPPNGRRTTTYPLPLPGSAPQAAMPYTPYPVPTFSLPPSSYISPAASPSSASFSAHPLHHHPYAHAGSSRGPSRSYTMPAPYPSFPSLSSGVPPPLPGRSALVDASVQTDLYAQQIPDNLAPHPHRSTGGGSTPTPGPLPAQQMQIDGQRQGQGQPAAAADQGEAALAAFLSQLHPTGEPSPFRLDDYPFQFGSSHPAQHPPPGPSQH